MGSGVPAAGMRLLLGVVVLLLPWFGAPAHGQGPELVVYRQLDRPVLTIRSSGAASGARSQRHPASPASMAPTRTRASFCSAEQTPMLGRACKARTRSFLIRLATSGTPSTEAPIPRLCLSLCGRSAWRRWMANQNRWVNGILGGWNLAGMLRYDSGQSFEVSAQNPFWPMWGNLYRNFNLAGFKGPNDPTKFPTVHTYMPASVASQPVVGQRGQGPPAIGSLRCPSAASEDAGLLKYFPMGSEGQSRLSFRVEFYNVFNRTTTTSQAVEAAGRRLEAETLA